MVSEHTFWEVMQTYNTRIWPAQLIMYVVAVALVVWLFVRPTGLQTLLLKVFLSVAFVFDAVLFYLLLGKGVSGNSYGSYFFGLLFLVVSVLFGLDVLRPRMRFSPAATGPRKVIMPVLTACALCYPLVGVALGRDYKSLIVPGAFPCPTTALGLIMLTTALPRVRRSIYIILLVCAVPFTLFYQVARHGVYEDLILFVVGIYALALLVKDWRSASRREASRSH